MAIVAEPTQQEEVMGNAEVTLNAITCFSTHSTIKIEAIF